MDFFKLISKENVGKTFHIKFLPSSIVSYDIIDNYPMPFGKYTKQIYVSNAMVNGEFKQLVYTQSMRDFLQIFFLGTRGYIIHPKESNFGITYEHHRVEYSNLEDAYLDLEDRYDITRDKLTYVAYPENVHPFNILYSVNNEYLINPYSFKLTIREITLFETSRLLDLGKIETVKYEPNMIIKDQSDSSINEAEEFLKSLPSLKGMAQYYVEAYHRDKLIDSILDE